MASASVKPGRWHAWVPWLRGHVSIAVDANTAAVSTLAPYEWIEVWLGCDITGEDRVYSALEATAAARAMSLVWRALAMCRGFSVAENPVFWRRVVDTFQRRASPESEHGATCMREHVPSSAFVDDAHAFFDCVFPRLKVNLHGCPEPEKLARVFCGVEAIDPCGGIDAKLLQILLRLAELVRSDGIHPEIEILPVVDLDVISEDRVNALILATHQVGTLNKGPQSPVNQLLNPPYMVRKVDVIERYWARETTNEEAIAYLSSGLQLSVPMLSRSVASPNRLMEEIELVYQAFVLAALQVADHDNRRSDTGAVSHLEFSPGWALRAICSALPHTRSATTFSLKVEARPSFISMEDDAVAWLGYALFHPDSPSSTWRHLLLSGILMDDGAAEVLAIMARGNNLHVALAFGVRDESTMANAYYTATLAPGTVLYERRGHRYTKYMAIGDTPATMDVSVASASVNALPEWVMVVVVGRREAWVRGECIQEIVARPSARPFLSSLGCSESLDVELFAMLIRLTGGALESVASDLTAGEALSSLSKYCPHLRALSLDLHWADVNDKWPTLVLPATLEELVLAFDDDIKGQFAFKDSPLSALHALRSLCIKSNSLPAVEDSRMLLLPALRTLRRLKRLLWMDVDSNSACMTTSQSYVLNRLLSRTKIHGFVPGVDDLALVDQRAPTEAVFALLSVTGVSAIAQLDQAALSLISQFTGTCVCRDVWVAPHLFEAR